MKVRACSRVYTRAFSVLAVALVLGGAGCEDQDPAGPATALFVVPSEADLEAGLETEFYALPYPNDLRTHASGLLDLRGITRSNPLLEEYLDAIELKQDGFGLTSGLFFRFDGQLDPTSLPATPSDSLAPDASVYLVNLNPESNNYGTRLPMEFRFEEKAGSMIGENWLACLPFPGFVMEEATTYAMVVTSRLRAEDGSAVKTADDFRALMSDEVPDEPRLVRGQSQYLPLRTYLDDAGGDERDDLVSAAVFTTQAPTALMGKFRDVIEALDVPAPRDFRWRRPLDTHDLYRGRYDSPNFQAGDYPYQNASNGGGFELEEDGIPIVQSTNNLRFAMSIPKGEMPADGWPVVIYAHGTGGDYQTFQQNGTAKRMAEQGIAVVSIDQVMHGDRLESGDVQTLFFNFLNPFSSRGNVMQAALEDFQLARLLVNFDFTERHVGGRTIRFDSEQIHFFGHSQGSVTGIPYVAQSRRVKGAVFSGAGGLLYLTMLSKKLPFDITDLVKLIIRDSPLDKFNPALALLQAFYEPADAIVYARLLVTEPPIGLLPKNVFQLLGYTDNFTPVPTIEALATAIGGDLIEPQIRPIPGLELKERFVLPPPFSGNIEIDSGRVTSVVAQYDQLASSDGHFVAFDIEAARIQTIAFIKSLVETGQATVVAP